MRHFREKSFCNLVFTFSVLGCACRGCASTESDCSRGQTAFCRGTGTHSGTWRLKHSHGTVEKAGGTGGQAHTAEQTELLYQEKHSIEGHNTSQTCKHTHIQAHPWSYLWCLLGSRRGRCLNSRGFSLRDKISRKYIQSWQILHFGLESRDSSFQQKTQSSWGSLTNSHRFNQSLKRIAQHSGKYTYLVSCQELNAKIDTTLRSVCQVWNKEMLS